MIIELDNVIYPFEIKEAAKPELSILKNFNILNNKNLNMGNGGLLCFYPDVLPLDENNKSYPISIIF